MRVYTALVFRFVIVLLLLFQNHFAQAQAPKQKCIMVFGSHADDADEIAGGTLAKYVASGYKGVYVVAINNLDGCNLERTPWFFQGPNFSTSSSPMKYPVDALETSQIREEEARQAAAVYPAEPVFINYKEPTFYLGRKMVYYGEDQYHEYDPPGRQLVPVATYINSEVDTVVELLMKYKPDIIITHTLGGEKLDHGNVAYMIYLAVKKAMETKAFKGKLWMSVNGWFLDSVAQKNGKGKADMHIDVRDYLKTKYTALNKHISQNGGRGREYIIENKVHPKEVVEEFITVLDNTR